eukprot:COSAG05_NODE_1627_length_4376_cov_3.480945_5_plen_90_part_00
MGVSAVETTHQTLAHVWKAAENARYFRLLEVAQDGLVGVFSLGELKRAREAVDLGPDHQWRRRRYTRTTNQAACMGLALTHSDSPYSCA